MGRWSTAMGGVVDDPRDEETQGEPGSGQSDQEQRLHCFLLLLVLQLACINKRTHNWSFFARSARGWLCPSATSSHLTSPP
jgi:hypothetical protein